jgi:hypothetical protein
VQVGDAPCVIRHTDAHTASPNGPVDTEDNLQAWTATPHALRTCVDTLAGALHPRRLLVRHGAAGALQAVIRNPAGLLVDVEGHAAGSGLAQLRQVARGVGAQGVAGDVVADHIHPRRQGEAGWSRAGCVCDKVVHVSSKRKGRSKPRGFFHGTW